MFSFLIILIVIAAILLVIIVLAQNPKGGGLSQGFSSSNQIMGVQNTNKFLTKATWSLVGFIAAVCIISAGIAIDSTASEGDQSEVIKTLQKEETQQTQQQAAPVANPFEGQAPAKK